MEVLSCIRNTFFYIWRENEVVFFIEDMIFKQRFPLFLSYLRWFENVLLDLFHMSIASKFLQKSIEPCSTFRLAKFRFQQGWSF